MDKATDLISQLYIPNLFRELIILMGGFIFITIFSFIQSEDLSFLTQNNFVEENSIILLIVSSFFSGYIILFIVSILFEIIKFFVSLKRFSFKALLNNIYEELDFFSKKTYSTNNVREYLTAEVEDYKDSKKGLQSVLERKSYKLTILHLLIFYTIYFSIFISPLFLIATFILIIMSINFSNDINKHHLSIAKKISR